jgi:hypothetical protein
LLEAVGGFEKALNMEGGVAFEAAGDVGADRLQILGHAQLLTTVAFAVNPKNTFTL